MSQHAPNEVGASPILRPEFMEYCLKRMDLGSSCHITVIGNSLILDGRDRADFEQPRYLRQAGA